MKQLIPVNQIHPKTPVDSFKPPEDMWAQGWQFSELGKFIRFERDQMIELFPEGLAGDFPRDLMLLPSQTQPAGLMLRKPMVDLFHQLDYWKDAPQISHRGWLLDGHRGTGKSQVLNAVVSYARQSGWFVIFEPTVSRFSKEIAPIVRSTGGVYVQNEFAAQYLNQISLGNREFLEALPIKSEIYGNTSLDGNNADLYTRKLYDPLVDRVVTQKLGAFREDKEYQREFLKQTAKLRADIEVPTLKEGFPNCETLWELLQFGMDHEHFATQVVYELHEQLKHQTRFPLLLVVDEWNECLPVSDYVSIRYDQTKYQGHIPAYHLSMPRLFHKFDGGSYKRGLKLVSTSWTQRTRRDFRPDLMGVKPAELITVRAFSFREFRNYVGYLSHMRVLYEFPEAKLKYFFMMTQGNGFQSRKLLSTLY